MADQDPTSTDAHRHEASASSGEPGADGSRPSAADGGTAWYAPLGRVARYAGRFLAGLVGLVAFLLLAFLLLLQTDWGARQATDVILSRLPLEDATVTVGETDGTWLTTLRLYDVTLTANDTTRLAHLDTLRLEYDLWSFLRRNHLPVREAFASGLDVTMRQQADSTWDLLTIFPTSTDTAQSTLTYRFDEITVRNARLRAAFYAPGRDSSLQVRRFEAHLTDLDIVPDTLPSFVGRLTTSVVPPGVDTPFDLDAVASMDENRLTVQALQLQSPRSMLTAEGTLAFPQEDSVAVDAIDMQVAADPIAFRDLHPFVPSLDPDASATFDAQVQGTSRQLMAQLDGSLSDGASLQLDATVTPGLKGPLAYRVDAEVRRFDPSLFAESETPIRLSGSLDADLQGTSLETLDGSLRADLFGLRFGEYAPERTTLTAQMNGGLARIDVQTGLRGTRLTAGGTIRPFAETPTYDLEGRLTDLDIGEFADDPAQSSDIDASFQASGSGFDPATGTGTFRFDLAPSRINQYEIREGSLVARVGDNAIDLDASVLVPEGRLAAAGQVTLGDVLRYRVEEGRFENLDVAALVGDTLQSSLTGTFSLRGQGTAPQTMRLDDLTLSLTDSRYGTYQIQQAQASGTLRDGRLDLHAYAVLDGGAFDLTATARPFAAVPTYRVNRGQFEGVHLGTLTQNPDLTTDLHGSFSLDGRGLEPERMTLTARLDLVDSQYNEQYIDEGSVTIELQQGTLTYEGRLDVPEGSTRLAGTITDVFGDAPAVAVREGRFQGLNLGALLGDPNLQSNLAGTFTFDGAIPLGDLSALREATLSARLTLDASTFNQAAIDSGRVDFELREGHADLDALLDLADGRARLNLSGRFFDEVPTYQATGRFERISLAQLTGTDTLNATFSGSLDVEGTGLDPQTMTLHARLTDVTARYDSVRVDDLLADVSLREGVLQVDTLGLRSNVLTAHGEGIVTLYGGAGTPASDFSLDATVHDLEPLRPFLDVETLSVGEASLRLRVYGRSGTLRFDAETSVSTFAYADIRGAGVELQAAGAMTDSLRLARAEIIGDAAYFSTPQFTAQDIALETTYSPDSLGFDVETVINEQETRITGRVSPQPDSQRVVLEDLSVRFAENRWQLLQEATVSYGEEYRVSNLLLYTEDQQIALDGVIDFNGEQSLVLTIEDVRIGAIADLLGYQGLNGSVYGTLDLTGPAVAPNLTGTLNFDVSSFDEPVGDLQLDVRYDSLRLNLEGQITHQDGSTMTIDGYVPLDLRLSRPTDEQGALSFSRPEDQALDLRIQADAFTLGWVEPFLDRTVVDRVGGELTVDLELGGTLASPRLSGDATLGRGHITLPELGVTYRSIRADLTFEGDQVVVNHAELNNDGSLIAEGTIDLSELTLGNFNLDASLESFRAIDTRTYRGEVSGDLTLRGTTQEPVLNGSLQVISADVSLTEEMTSEEFEPVTLQEQDLQMLERQFGVRVAEADTTTFDFYEALEMNLSVELERNVWLRSQANPEMNIQFTGDLDLQKAAYEDVLIFGTIDVLEQRSYITQFGRRFGITSGTLTFNGVATEPYLNLEAAYDVPSRRNQGNEIAILLSVEGRPDDLDLTLSSDPPTDMTNIVSYIATGRPASEAFQLGGEGALTTQGAGLALSQLTNIIESAAGTELGLDVIEIRQNGFTGTTITAGKYLTRRLYVEVSQPISFSGNAAQEGGTGTTNAGTRVFSIEYELFEWLLARASSGGSSLKVDLLWEYSY